jgi:histidyl-tRNA synthetase
MAMMLPKTLSVPDLTSVYVAGFGDHGSAAGFSALEQLRVAGIPAVTDFRSGSLKSHLRQADRMHSRFALIIGDDEVVKGSAILRDMQTKVQQAVSLASLSVEISSFLRSS